MMLNIVLGAGLLTLPGLAAQVAGDAALFVWILCALAASPLLVVFALLGKDHPDAGGIAAVLKKAFGAAGYAPAVFLFLGAVAVGLPSIAITGGHYAASVLGGSEFIYGAALILGALLANLARSEIAGRINAAIASVVVAVMFVIAVLGWNAASPNWDELAVIPSALPETSVLAMAFMMVFFAFTGWEVAANLSGEFKRPGRDIPLAMTASFLVAVALYLALAIVVAASGPEAAVEAPFTAILGQAYGPAGAWLVALIALVLIFANLTAAIWAVSRMVCSAASERLLVHDLSHVRGGVPTRAVLATTAVLLTVVLAASGGWVNLGGLLAAAGQNFILLYAGAALALMRLATRPAHRALGAVSLAVVAVVMSGRGLDGIFYSATLCGLGLFVAYRRMPSLQKAS